MLRTRRPPIRNSQACSTRTFAVLATTIERKDDAQR
jgi:hypothetical protein